MMTENFESVNHLVLNFYPDGYTIAVKLNEFPVFTSETILETAKISYEETSLLDYIENEELPPLLVEMIDGSPKLSQYKIWHNGCLILEVRDKINLSYHQNEDLNIYNDSATVSVGISNGNSRYCIPQKTAKEFSDQHHSFSLVQSDNGNHHHHNHHHHHNNNRTSVSTTSTLHAQWMLNGNNEIKNNNSKDYINDCADKEKPESPKSSTNGSYFILLKPTNLSMLNDVLNLTESETWSTRDRLQLESQIVLYNSAPLFLEPDATKQPPEQFSQWPNLKISNTICTRHKKKLPHIKLMDGTRYLANGKTAGSGNNSKSYNNLNYNGAGSNARNNLANCYNSATATSPPTTTNNSIDSCLPPELTLQQFLANQRAKKKPFAAGHLARFHRFKKHLTSNSK